VSGVDDDTHFCLLDRPNAEAHRILMTVAQVDAANAKTIAQDTALVDMEVSLNRFGGVAD
jgi:hypothetical protein